MPMLQVQIGCIAKMAAPPLLLGLLAGSALLGAAGGRAAPPAVTGRRERVVGEARGAGGDGLV